MCLVELETPRYSARMNKYTQQTFSRRSYVVVQSERVFMHIPYACLSNELIKVTTSYVSEVTRLLSEFKFGDVAANHYCMVRAVDSL